jgi:hypothetical protein
MSHLQLEQGCKLLQASGIMSAAPSRKRGANATGKLVNYMTLVRRDVGRVVVLHQDLDFNINPSYPEFTPSLHSGTMLARSLQVKLRETDNPTKSTATTQQRNER